MATSLSGRGRQNFFVSVAASQTDSSCVAAVAGRKIRVVAFLINHGDTTPSSVTFNSKGSGAGTAIFAPLKYPANGGTSVPECGSGWFETIAGEGLTVNTGAGSTTAIAGAYEIVS